MHPGVVIGGLAGLSAALSLVTAIGRALYKAVATAQQNAGAVEKLVTDVAELQDQATAHDAQLGQLGKVLADVGELQDQAHDHDTRLAVMEALGENDPQDGGK